MLRFGQVLRSYCRSLLSSAVNAMNFLLIFLYWQGVSTDAASSPSVANSAVTPETDYAVTYHETIVSKGHVIVQELEILKPQKIELSCIISDIPNNPTHIIGYWKKNGNEIENSKQTVYKVDKQRFIFKRIFNIQVNDLGNYSCIFSYLDKQEQVTFLLKENGPNCEPTDKLTQDDSSGTDGRRTRQRNLVH